MIRNLNCSSEMFEQMLWFVAGLLTTFVKSERHEPQREALLEAVKRNKALTLKYSFVKFETQLIKCALHQNLVKYTTLVGSFSAKRRK